MHPPKFKESQILKIKINICDARLGIALHLKITY